MKKLWDTLSEPPMLISLIIMSQFVLLVILFGMSILKMSEDAKQTILQAYVVAFTAAWGYWLGSSAGSKKKDELLSKSSEQPPKTP